MPVKMTYDPTFLVYQPVSDWLKAVKSKHGKPVANRCLKIVRKIGGGIDTMVSDLKKDRIAIIKQASKIPKKKG